MHFFSLLPAAWIFLLAALTGRKLMKMFDLNPETELETFAFGLALGYGVVAYLIFILGLLHLYTAMVVFGCFAVLTAWTFSEWTHFFRSLPQISFKWILNPVALFAGCICSLAVLQAFAPSTAHDAMAYQLDIPKRFVQAAGIVYLPYKVNSTFPLLMNMYYVLSLLWDQTVLANLFHLSMAFGIALGVAALAKKENWSAAIAVAIFVSTPGIFNQMVIAYNDVGFTFFIFYAFYAVVKWNETRDFRWIVLAGCMLGFSLSVKYLGVLAGTGIVLFLTLRTLRGKIDGSEWMRLMASLGLPAFFLSVAWYFRTYHYEHKWMYFGAVGYEASASAVRGVAALAVPWLMTMKPDSFGGSWAQIGPVYLAFLPAVFFMRNRNRAANILLFLSSCYFIFWLCLPRQNLRFLFPVLPSWALLIAYVISEISWQFFFKRLLLGTLLVLLGLQGVLAAYHGKDEYSVALGTESAEQYLNRMERTYRIAGIVNALPPGSRILNAYEVRTFYFDPPMEREREYRAKTRYDQKNGWKEITDTLKTDGFTHVLIASTPGEIASVPPTSLPGLARDPVFRTTHLKELAHLPAFGRDPVEYSLYELI